MRSRFRVKYPTFFRASSLVWAWTKQRLDHRVDPSFVQFIATLFSPLRSQFASRAVDGRCHLPEMPLGVIEVHDLNGAGEVLLTQVPYPLGAVAQNDPPFRLVESPSLRLAIHPLRKRRRCWVYIRLRCRLDRLEIQSVNRART